jgi:hypothetical protein
MRCDHGARWLGVALHLQVFIALSPFAERFD